MAADIDPEADPRRPARCPRRLMDEPTAPRCRSLVLAGDADEHEGWHDTLDGILELALRGPESSGAARAISPGDWPDRASDVADQLNADL